jgi:alpha-mannosidase
VLVWETASYGVAHGLRHFNGDRTKMFRTADPTQNFIDGYVLGRLRQLADEGYPYDCIAFPWSGTDNFPVDADVPYAARHWNETYVTPKVVVSTVREACKALVKRYGSKIPTFRGDLTPYWEDGAGSSARETAMNRASADRLVQAETLTAMTRPSAYDGRSFWKAWSDVILYSEHTWGAFNSVTEPVSEFARKQWAYKQNFAVEAAAASTRLLERARGTAPGSLSVVNTSSWPRSDLVILNRSQSAAGDRVVDSANRPVPSQRLRSGDLAVLVRGVPAFGSVRLRVGPGRAFSPLGKATASAWNLRSPEWQVSIDRKTGGLSRLWSAKLRRDLAGRQGDVRPNQYLYVLGSDARNASSPSNVCCEVVENGPLVARLRLTAAARAARTLTQDIQLAAGLDRVDLSDNVDKIAVREKEAAHFSFPFKVPDGQVRIHVPWAVIRPDFDQMPGANKNWFTTQYFADISNRSFGVTWSSLDAPLLEVGGITATMLDGGFDPKQWIREVGPTQTIYSWALNNHWYTNYKADQEGMLTFRYSLRAHGPYAADDAYRFGAGLAQPLLVSSGASKLPLLTVSDSRIVVTALKPSEDGKALIARLWCVGDEPSLVRLQWRSGMGAMSLSDASERPLRRLSGTVRLAGWQIVTVRAELGPRQVAPASRR